MAYLDITDCFTAPAGVLTPYAPTATGNNINTASYIDRLVKMDDGIGEPLDVLLLVTQAVASVGAATCDFQILGNATDPTFASGNIVMADSGVIAKATLVAGYQVTMTINQQFYAALEAGNVLPRYYALNVNIGTAALTAGAFNCWLTANRSTPGNLTYPSGYTV